MKTTKQTGDEFEKKVGRLFSRLPTVYAYGFQRQPVESHREHELGPLSFGRVTSHSRPDFVYIGIDGKLHYVEVKKRTNKPVSLGEVLHHKWVVDHSLAERKRRELLYSPLHQWTSRSDSRDLNRYRGTPLEATLYRCIVVTNSTFEPRARDEEKESRKKGYEGIFLIDGEHLAELQDRYDPGKSLVERVQHVYDTIEHGIATTKKLISYIT